MIEVSCDSVKCIFNKDGKCTREYINLEFELTIGGFVLTCLSNTDRDGGDDEEVIE